MVDDVQPSANAAADAVLRVFERWPLPMVIIDSNGCYAVVNEASAAWLGYTPQEMVGRSAHDFEAPDVAVDLPFAEALGIEPLPPNVLAYRRKDGQIVWGQDDAVVLEQTLNLGIGRVVQTRDVTDLIDRRQRDARERWRIALAEETAHVGTFEIDLATNTQISSAEYGRMHLREPDSPVPPFTDGMADIHPDDHPLVRAALASPDAEFDVTYRFLRDPANPRLIHTQGRTISRPDGRPGWVVGIARDVTEERAAAEAQRQAEKEYRRAMRAQQRRLEASQAAGQVGTWEIDLATGESTLSPEYQRLHGEVVGSPDRGIEKWLADVHPDDRDRMRATWDNRQEYAEEYRWIRDPDDVRIFVEHGVWIPGEEGHPGYLVGTAHDITDVRRKEAELRHLADHEPLTRLLNRRAFERAYERFMASGRDDTRGHGAVFLLDLDRFKHHNDTYGHQRGDEILSVVADALRGRLRDGDDVAARWGGDEFIALVPRLTLEQAESVAADLVRRVAERTAAASPDASNPVTVSLGVVLLDDDPDVLTAVHRADNALYAAKNAGRNQWARWTAG